MKIRSIIVEDEYSAREALKAYIQKYCPQIELLGEAADAKQAIEMIHQKRPQLVFLDVELPFGNAFDILESCKGVHFETIFITAYSEYSLRALNLSAAYYILKPVNIEELIVAVNKVAEILEKQQIFDRNLLVLENFKSDDIETKNLLLPTMEGFELLKMKNIVRLQGNGNFTDIYLLDGSKKMACRFLKHYEEILPYPFLRIHKSHIINLHFVTSYSKSDGGYVVLQDKSEILISQSYKEQFLEKFKLL
jgi:two-component system LytT family response regulator